MLQPWRSGMNQWLAENSDAIALAVIVLAVLAGYAPMTEAGSFFHVPVVLPTGKELLRLVTSIFGGLPC